MAEDRNPGSGPAEPKFVNGFTDGTDLVLLHRSPDGQMLARRRPAEWSSFYKSGSIPAPTMRDLRGSQAVAGISEEGEWTRVRWRADEWRRKAHESEVKDAEGKWVPGYFSELGIQHFEADVNPIRRFFSESGARVAQPHRCFIDIETDSRVPPAVARRGKARVLCWAIGVDDTPEADARDPSGVRMVASGVLDAETDDAERALLEAFWRAVDPYDQLVAWFGDDFDFPILRERARMLGAKAKDFRRWLYLDQLVVHERMNRNAAESGDEKESLKLGDVAKQLVGEGKDDFDASKTYEAWAAGGAERARMLRYCQKDVALLPRIERKTGYIALNAVLCEIARCFQETANVYPIPIVDGVLLRMGVERGLRFPTLARPEEHQKFAGAFVLEPKFKGIRKNVHVFDFAGMYPSIMLTYNMSPETRRHDVAVNGPIPPGACRSPSTRVGFALQPTGVIPEALKEIRAKRKHWQKLQASLPPGTPEWHDAGRRSNAYKVAANVFFGASGSPFCRFYDRGVAESTSQTGAWLIQKTLHAAEEREGMAAIYADTDSGFVEGVSREQVARFVAWCNAELYPAAVKECGCEENYIDVAYEKEFERVVFCGKKRYFGVFRHYKWTTACECTTPDGEPGALDVRTMTCRDCGRKWEELPPPRGKPEVKGLEYKRGDTIQLCRDLQYAVIEKLCARCEDPAEFVSMIERMRDRILNEPMSADEVRQSGALGKSLREYVVKKKKDGTDAAEPHHVQVARVLQKRGEQIGEGVRVFYYVKDASESPMTVLPISDYAADADRHYLWENLVYPATKRVLEAAFPPEPGMSAAELQARDWSRYERTRPKAERVRKEPEDRNPGSGQTARKPRPPTAQVDLFIVPTSNGRAPIN